MQYATAEVNRGLSIRPWHRCAMGLGALVLWTLLPASTPVEAQEFEDAWVEVAPDTDGDAHVRHEGGLVQAGDRYFMIGGRRIQPVDIFDPAAGTWTAGARPPIELHHFQAVTYHGLIVIAGALVGPYPFEVPASHLFLYDPIRDRWTVGPEIPAHRRRGAAGVVIHDDKLYLVSGVVNGHVSHWVPWLDEFDFSTNTWRELPDAPRARDHFHAAVVDGRIYAAGGRRSGAADVVFGATVAEVDVFDLATETWETLPPSSNIPTRRAGTVAAAIGDELVVIGGESDTQDIAHEEVEALNVHTGEWRTLPPLRTPRHGTQLVANDLGLFVAGGSGRQGGSPELVHSEQLRWVGASGPAGPSLEPGSLAAVESRTDGNGTLHVTVANEGGDQAVVLTHALTTDGSGVTAPYGFPYVLIPGATVDFSVSSANGDASILVRAWQPGPPLVLPSGP